MILDGRTIANHILDDLTQRVHDLEKNYGIQPHLAVVRLGDDPATTSYVNQKEKIAKQIGALVSVYNFPENATEGQIQESLDFLQTKTDIHGTILQLPLPKHLREDLLLAEIHPEKDVDGFGVNSPFPVPLASAVMKFLEICYLKEGTEFATLTDWLKSLQIVVLGKGKTGGQPVIDMLKKEGIEPIVVDSHTPHPEQVTQEADIIISAVGKEKVITKQMIKKDAILIGIGMHKRDDDSFAGDYDEEDIKDTASWYTPIPGGVGPVNVACLMENLVLATERSVQN